MLLDIRPTSYIDSIKVFYPGEMWDDSGLYNATTLSGGFNNTKEDMYWLAEDLAENGMIVFALSASSNLSVSAYTNAQLSCFNLIQQTNENSSSPLYHRIDKIALMGFSMGGGGVLNAANELGSELDAVISLAPFNPDNNLGGVSAPVLMIVGSNDGIADPSLNAEPAYYDLPGNITKALMELDSFGHLDWMNNTADAGTETSRLLINSWFKYALEGDYDAYNNIVFPPSGVSLTWITF